MGRADKKLEKMRNNPRGDWTIEELNVVAEDQGIVVRNHGGSHFVYSHPDIHHNVSVPARRPIKPSYIRQFVAFVDEVSDIANELKPTVQGGK
jgi:hypothetical protein